MNQKPSYSVHTAAAFFLLIVTHAFAIEVQDVKVTRGEDGRETKREYVLATDGKIDHRFNFIAWQEHSLGSGFRWTLDLAPANTFDWANELPFKEYLEAVYRCVDRFVTDVPGGRVYIVMIYITSDSRTWQDIRKKLVPIVKDRVGFAVEFPKPSNAVAELTFRSSPEVKQLGLQLAKKLNRKFTNSLFVMDGLVLNRKTHEDYTRTWQDIVKLPDLSLNMYSVGAQLDFESLEATR